MNSYPNPANQSLPTPTSLPTGTQRVLSARRPTELTSATCQSVVLVRDKSPSMDEDGKAQAATAAVADLVDELAKPENKGGFDVAIVDYADSAEVVQAMDRSESVNGRVPPIRTTGNGTNISDGLEFAIREIEANAAKVAGSITGGPPKRIPLRPFVLLFTDGRHNRGPAPEDVAARLKGKADLVTIAFGNDADEPRLRALASSPQLYFKAANGRDLRLILAAVGQTLSMSLRTGRNPTVGIGQLTFPK